MATENVVAAKNRADAERSRADAERGVAQQTAAELLEQQGRQELHDGSG